MYLKAYNKKSAINLFSLANQKVKLPYFLKPRCVPIPTPRYHLYGVSSLPPSHYWVIQECGKVIEAANCN